MDILSIQLLKTITNPIDILSIPYGHIVHTLWTNCPLQYISIYRYIIREKESLLEFLKNSNK